MKNLTTFFLVLLFASTVFAQTDNSERVSSVLDGLREAYTPEDYQLFLIREQNGEIPFAGGLVDMKAATDALVNNNAGATGTGYFTQSEMSIPSLVSSFFPVCLSDFFKPERSSFRI